MHRWSELDWNDVRLILAIAEFGSFQKAARALKIDQATVSRRVGALERRCGCPLFIRRASGAVPSLSGQALVALARNAGTAIARFERALDGAGGLGDTVTIATTEGIATYLLGPALSARGADLATALGPGPTTKLPAVRFVRLGSPADLEIMLLEPGAAIPRHAWAQARKIGAMTFELMAGARYLAAHGPVDGWSALAEVPLLNHESYEVHPACRPWRSLIDDRGRPPVATWPTSSALHRATVLGGGVTLLPTFSPLLDDQVRRVCPDFNLGILVEIWIVAEPEALRLASVRHVYDAVSALFNATPWLGV